MTLKTKYEEIVDVNLIGKDNDSQFLNNLLTKASKEDLIPAIEDKEKNLLIPIDLNRDFMENGALPVPNSFNDTNNLNKFIYNNIEKITKILISLDTHIPQQIFFPCWWINQKNEHPDPFTEIKLEDLDSGKWIPIIDPIESREYVKNLENLKKKNLIIWPYHCIQGTKGQALESQFSNMLYFYSIVRKSAIYRHVKGLIPLSEMYGIFKAEYDPKGRVKIDLLNQLEVYDRIIIAGQAKSHCVMESIRQMLEFYEKRPEITSKIYILEDCMSSIQGFETTTEAIFEDFKKQYKVNIVKSTDLKL